MKSGLISSSTCNSYPCYPDGAINSNLIDSNFCLLQNWRNHLTFSGSLAPNPLSWSLQSRAEYSICKLTTTWILKLISKMHSNAYGTWRII